MTLKTKKRNFGGSVGNFGRKYERKVIMNFCPGSGQTCTLVFTIKPLISNYFSNLELSLISTYVPDMPSSIAVESKNLVTM